MNITSPRAFLFDVDGVIMNIVEKKITEPGIIEAVCALMNKGDLVCINTGRSIAQLFDKGVIDAIEKCVGDRKSLSYFIASCEKGGSHLTYGNGEQKSYIDETLILPQDLRDAIRDLTEKKFTDSMFFDGTKQTMISVEMIDRYSVPQYQKRQQALIEEIDKILNQPKYSTLDLKVDPTLVSVDIQHKEAGKNLGARKIVEWLASKGITPAQIIAIGDSTGDAEMAEELQDKYAVEFVFVGDPELLDKSRLHCPVIVTKERFEKGTLEYLQSL